MPITNVSKPTTSLTNASRVASYETWATIATTWATETRTWADCASLLDNIARTPSSITNVAKP